MLSDMVIMVQSTLLCCIVCLIVSVLGLDYTTTPSRLNSLLDQNIKSIRVPGQETLNISCPSSGDRLYVHSAQYDSGSYRYRSSRYGKCMEVVTPKVLQLCANGASQCSIANTFHKLQPNISCLPNNMYLNLNYTCVPESQQVQTTVVCTGEEFRPICNSSQILKIHNARYGVLGKNRCSSRHLASCVSDVTKLVRNVCNGWRYCNFTTLTHELYAYHPCSKDVLSYLEVDYSCVWLNRDACLGENFNLSCPAPYKIQLEKGHYGRMASGRCMSMEAGNPGCYSDIKDRLQTTCDGRSSCALPVLDKDILNSTNCPVGLAGYVQAQYACIKPVATAVQTAEFCENESYINLPCSVGHFPNIISAMIGRMHTGRCISSSRFIGCSSDVTRTVRNTCKSTSQNCMFPARNLHSTSLGPCPIGYDRYIEIKFNCIPR